jgi:3-oxoacyl-[acyl-carrier-protein] synthase II
MRHGARRVVVTGLGALSCVGSGKDAFWQGALSKSGARAISRFDPSPFACHIAGEIADFEPLQFMDAQKAKRLDRFAQFSLATAKMALADSGLDLNAVNREAVGIYIGSALGGISFAEEQHGEFIKRGIKGVRPTLAISVFGGASSCNIAMELGTYGPNIANANSCASGAIAIGEAARAIALGDADVMIAGGVESPLSQLVFGSFSLIRAMSTRNGAPGDASRPFDRGRDGFVMAEGAGILVLEEYEAAKKRGAAIYAEILGYATTNDAYSMTSPRLDSAQSSRCMRLALQDAGQDASSIDYVNAHGSSTPLNDTYEAQAIGMVMGERSVPVSSTKGSHAHALGASGAMELALCSMAFGKKLLPPNANFSEGDEGVKLDLIGREPRAAAPKLILSNSFGFGGINACVVLGRV